jgi:hypothetical protein
VSLLRNRLSKLDQQPVVADRPRGESPSEGNSCDVEERAPVYALVGELHPYGARQSDGVRAISMNTNRVCTGDEVAPRVSMRPVRRKLKSRSAATRLVFNHGARPAVRYETARVEICAFRGKGDGRHRRRPGRTGRVGRATPRWKDRTAIEFRDICTIDNVIVGRADCHDDSLLFKRALS